MVSAIDSTGRCCRLSTANSGVLCPTLLDHRCFPSIGCAEYVVVRPAHLRHLQRSRNLEAQFPAERVRHESARGLELLAAFLFVEAKHVAEVLGFAVPIGTLEDFERHAPQDTPG